MNNPLISAIIPCHNSAEYVGDAIQSMACQTYKNLEIIIVDDNSTDNLNEIVEPYLKKYNNIKFVKLPYDDPMRVAPNGVNINAGYMAKNYGMEIAKGEIFTFQDADDGSCSNRIEYLYNVMQEKKVMFISCGWQQYKDEYNCERLDWNLTDEDIMTTKEILKLAHKTRPRLFKHPFGKNEYNNPIEKFFRKVDRKFFNKNWGICYPGASGSFMMRREVFDKCRFRQLYERTRPSKAGRGKDRDLGFWIAETFKSSLILKVPLYLWRVKEQNSDYKDDKYRPK